VATKLLQSSAACLIEKCHLLTLCHLLLMCSSQCAHFIPHLFKPTGRLDGHVSPGQMFFVNLAYIDRKLVYQFVAPREIGVGVLGE
jgi:hypothetical protein